MMDGLRKGTVKPNGPEIERRRQGKGWTQDDLEKKVGCGIRTIQRLENGESALVRTIAELAGALGCEPKDLLISQDSAPVPSDFVVGNSPPPPPLVIGRDHDLRKLKSMLLRIPDDRNGLAQAVAVVWGLPGVGKSTVAAVLAND